jgi:sugar lactone lactonase YvrE
MQVERLTDPGAVVGEGPVWDAGTGTLLWVNILDREVRRTDPRTGATEIIDTPSAVGAVALDQDGGLIAAMVDGVYRRDGDTWERLVGIEADDEGTRANDSKCDPFGNFLVGTMAWAGDSPTGSLYRVRPDLSVDVLRTGLTISNGLAWAEDTMWHIDTPTGQIVGFRYSAQGPLGEQVGVIDVEAEGGPDGMCLDDEGCLWVAIWGAGAVRRYSRDGRVLAEIAVPASQASSCAFGGAELSLLFITTATEGLAHPEPDAGAVFVAEPGVRGLPPDLFGRR